ncbi:MAG: hypothetical protein K0B87_07665 [Candidatus Syntrophosphaera sp.]|nr:hypothetical protein [Candidatus Syntrophosphaera sp.]
MTKEPNDKLLLEVKGFLQRNAEMHGARILSYLIAHAGHRFHCTKLARLVFPPADERMQLLAAQADLLYGRMEARDLGEQGNTVSVRDPANPQLMTPQSLNGYDLADLITCRHYDNPLTDAKTLRDIAKRCQKLKTDIAANIKPEQARAELQALLKYRSQCLMPGNKIKHFNPETAKTYQALQQAIHRLLNKLSAEQAPLLDYVRSCLKSGVEFGWKDPNNIQ